ncbi:hypothetical protein QMS73_17430, partial [Cronobacter sakazakii]|nr:hypothetical protein [Cronobacter sakazakii]
AAQRLSPLSHPLRELPLTRLPVAPFQRPLSRLKSVRQVDRFFSTGIFYRFVRIITLATFC